MKIPLILLAILGLAAVGGELSSYNASSELSRLLIVTVFSITILLITLAHVRYLNRESSHRRLVMLFIFFTISMLFLLRRYYLMSPNIIQAILYSETYTVAEKLSTYGVLLSGSQHSFLFQHPLLISLLNGLGGISFSNIVYLSLSIHAIVVAFASSILYEALRKLSKSYAGLSAYLIAPLVTFCMISFAYSERSELALPMLFLLMSFLFSRGLVSGRNAAIVLVFVVGITLGSSTAMLVMIPLFFLFAIFSKKSTIIVYALIPLTYLLYAGYSYSLSLRYYSFFTMQGLSGFLTQLSGGSLPNRIIPWERVVLPMLIDVRVASIAYISVILLSAFILMTGFIVWLKNRRSNKSRHLTLFLSALITLFLALGVASSAYIGASVNPENTSSDIRTIAIVLATLLMPFIFVSGEFIGFLKKRKLILVVICTLIILASLRTYYEPYPISKNDPINLVEDMRVDSFTVISVGNFLKKASTGINIAFDYKTGPRLSNMLSDYNFTFNGFSEKIDEGSLVVFNANGVIYGSLHTSEEAYQQVVNLTSIDSVIYNSQSILVVDNR